MQIKKAGTLIKIKYQKSSLKDMVQVDRVDKDTFL